MGVAMQSIESEGDSIDEAISNALHLLQVDRDRVEIEILSDATPGLFRLGRKKARVRATLRAPLWEVSDRSSGTGAEPVVSRGTTLPDGGRQASTAFETRCTDLRRELLSHIGVPCEVTSRPGPDPGTLLLEASGDSSGLLIGRRGQTLDAIEYMLNRMATRSEDGSGRVVVDVEGYRCRREDYLHALARRLADKAKRSARVVTLNPMSPRDRRIVHMVLQDDPDVETRSQGEGYHRQLLIVPALRGAERRPRSGSTPN